MFSIYKNNRKISGACRSIVLCLDYVAISPFTYFNIEINICVCLKLHATTRSVSDRTTKVIEWIIDIMSRVVSNLKRQTLNIRIKDK